MKKVKKILATSALTLMFLPTAPTNAGLGDPYVGEIMWVPYNFAPRGWAFCDGQLLPISSYTSLFSLIGTIYGGDGRTSFALPDVRSRVMIHEGNGAGLSLRRLGEKGGTENETLTLNQIPSHSHTLRASGGNATQTTPAGNALASPSRTRLYDAAPNTNMNDGSIASTGGNQSHNNMQPYTVLNCIIALQGSYPSRN